VVVVLAVVVIQATSIVAPVVVTVGHIPRVLMQGRMKTDSY
jgi:hypothetical protein